jgi:hypothetical protein
VGGRQVNLATWDKNKIHFITASNDMTAKLVDAKTLGAPKTHIAYIHPLYVYAFSTY